MLAPIQIFVGDAHGLNTLAHQPAKIAAVEGLWETRTAAPMLLFAIPIEKERANRYEIEVPGGASLILGHSFDFELRGLNEFPGRHPPVAPVFWAFRVMVAVGVLMLLVSWIALWRLRGGRTPGRALARSLALMTFAGWVAVEAGWYVTEIGRQPWLVHGVLTTADAAGPVPGGNIALTLAMYLALYAVLMVSFVSVLFYMARHAAAGRRAKELSPIAGPFPATGMEEPRHD